MSNHQRNLTSSKKTLKTKYKLANVNETIERADLQLSKFGMTLVGFEDNMCCSYKDADRLHIIRTDKITNTELLSDNVFFKSLVLVLSILFFEHNHISLVKLNEMVKDHISVKQLDVMKAKHYIAYKEENEQVYVNFGWRYYVEFKDFNPTKILNTLKINEMSQMSNLEQTM